MGSVFGIVTAEHCYLRRNPGKNTEQNSSGIEDEIFSGWAVRIFPESRENCWVMIETHYGYQGYVRISELRMSGQEELQCRQNKERFWLIGVKEADLLDAPKVQGQPLGLLLKNSIVELVCTDAETGWSQVRTASGREGYVHTAYLKRRRDDDGYLLQEKELVNSADSVQWMPGAEPGCESRNGYFLQKFQNTVLNETQFRINVVQSALSYLGTQYRWGGKSSQGIDCSGLIFMSYLENGVIIFRDSRIEKGYPVREISREELKKGDIIYFQGHVALYLGDGKYIHATAHKEMPYVTINSLNPMDADYRGDLAGKIAAYGSVFFHGLLYETSV